MAQFRFMDLEIWKESINLNDQLFDLADAFVDAKSYRVAEQLRAASLNLEQYCRRFRVFFVKRFCQFPEYCQKICF